MRHDPPESLKLLQEAREAIYQICNDSLSADYIDRLLGRLDAEIRRQTLEATSPK